ncbi:MAG: hydroxypyruvate isomerase [Pseudomonadota bacterium]
MPRFAANLSFLFQEVDFPARFEKAAKAGFRGVEYLFPYEWPADQLAQWLSSAGLEQVLFNVLPGDWGAGDRGIACHPGKELAFRRSVDQALEYATKLGCHQLHAMAGLALPGVSEDQHEAVFLKNLTLAAEQCASAGVCLLIEPINSRIDMPGYWLNSPEKAFRIQRVINHPALQVQLDLYHAQVMGADLFSLIKQYLPVIGHFQIADFPGRNEPGTGDIDFPSLFAQMDEMFYSGWIGCEYRPTVNTETSLHWFNAVKG